MTTLDLLLPLARLARFRPGLRERVHLADGVEWVDDYFAVHRVDDATVAILEPRYHQQNVNYLLLGRDRALLFDSGPGLRDLAAVVRRLTRLPVTVTCSHMHYDHVGGLGRFDDVALLDLPAYRSAVRDGVFVAPRRLHWGDLEGLPRPAARIGAWWPDGAVVDLGGRRLRVLHTPGHSRDGMCLVDPDRHQVFLGDLAYPKGVYAFLPDSDVDAYVRSCERLLDLTDADSALLSAHTGRPERVDVPVMRRSQLAALHTQLRRVRDGEVTGTGLFPRRYPVDDRMVILTAPRWRRSGRRPRRTARAER